jgi:hypothetical protein
MFVHALRKGVDFVARQERDFWQSREPLLVRYVDAEDGSRWIDLIEARLKPLYWVGDAKT